jgi:hypothetical protein
MVWAIWGGTAVTALGLAGLVWCIVAAMRARKAGLTDDQIRARMQKVVAVNVGALALSALGLMLVVFGVILT